MPSQVLDRKPRAASRRLRHFRTYVALLSLLELAAGDEDHTATQEAFLDSIQDLPSGAADNAQEITRAPEYEIVIARYSDNATRMAWLAEIPPYYQITLINKGGEEHPMPVLPAGRKYLIVNDSNVGREGDSFAGHLVRRYDSLASYTIFCQGDPFLHNEFYLELLKHPAMLGRVQTMSRLYLSSGEFSTPQSAIDAMSTHPYYRSERFSLRTLNSVWYHDEGSINVMWGYWKAHGLEAGDNIMAHAFRAIGLSGWVPESQEVGSFSFGALIGFEKSTALQHPHEVYQRLQAFTQGDWSNNFIVERMWSMLFGGPAIRDI